MLAIQVEQIDLHGGSHGVRDVGLIESALGRVRQFYYIAGERDVLTLAVRLGVGIAANHGFVDGNKRAGAFAMLEFLGLNGVFLVLLNDVQLGEWFEAVMAHRMSERELVDVLMPFVSAYET